MNDLVISIIVGYLNINDILNMRIANKQVQTIVEKYSISTLDKRYEVIRHCIIDYIIERSTYKYFDHKELNIKMLPKQIKTFSDYLAVAKIYDDISYDLRRLCRIDHPHQDGNYTLSDVKQMSFQLFVSVRDYTGKYRDKLISTLIALYGADVNTKGELHKYIKVQGSFDFNIATIVDDKWYIDNGEIKYQKAYKIRNAECERLAADILKHDTDMNYPVVYNSFRFL